MLDFKHYLKIKIFNKKNKAKHIIAAYDSIIKDSTFEGHNKVASNSIINESFIGQGSYIGTNCHIGSTKIGKFCSIGRYVRIVNGNHPSRDFVSTHPAFYRDQILGYTFHCKEAFSEFSYSDEEKKWCCEIGNDVWIGDSALILNGVKISDGAIVAAGAVVVKDVPPYAIVGGVPAKVIRYRFNNEQIEWLEKLKWWDKDEEWLQSNASLFGDINALIESYII